MELAQRKINIGGHSTGPLFLYLVRHVHNFTKSEALTANLIMPQDTLIQSEHPLLT
jgi:hypothetical protein